MSDANPRSNADETGFDADEAAREAVDTDYYDECRDRMADLLDADPLDPTADVSRAEFETVGTELAEQWARVQQRRRTARREARAAAQTDTETGESDGPLAGTLARVRGAVDAVAGTDDDSDGPEVVERDGRRVVVGEYPIGAADMLRLQAMDDGRQQDVWVRNQRDDAVQRGPPAGESDSPLVSKYHLNAGCRNADFSARSYSRAGLADAKRQAVPCPACVIQPTAIRTVADALDKAPEFDDLTKGERSRVGFLAGWPDAERRERYGQIQRAIRSLDGEATAAEIADSKGVDTTQQQVSTDLKRMASNRVVEHRQDGDGRTLWATTAFAVTR